MYSNITLQTNTNTPTPTGKCLLTESLVYARTSGAVFVYALHRFAGEASVREFASRYAKVGLSVFMQCEVQASRRHVTPPPTSSHRHSTAT